MATGDIDFGSIPDPLREPSSRAPSVAAGAKAAALDIPPPPALDEPSPTRAEASRSRWIATFAGVLWIAVMVVAVLGLRPDLLRLPVLVQLGLWTVALPFGLAVALRPRASGWPAGVVALRVALAALVGVFAGLALWPVSGTESPLTARTVGVCLSLAFLLAVPPLAAAVVVLRRAFVNAPALRGAVVGAVCGLAGSVGIHSHCPVVTTSHVLLAHGLPVVLLAAVGVLFGIRRGRV
jgi:hypothetical protein